LSWKRYFRRSEWDRERQRELLSHLEIETDENLTRGVAPHEARFAAQRKLGNTTQIREEIYHMNSLGFLETLGQDVRFGVRILRRKPAFTAIAILTLALGIGASSAAFTIVDTVLLKPLPYADANRIIVPLRQVAPGFNLGYNDINWGINTFHKMEATHQNFDTPAALEFASLVLTGAGEPTQVHTVRASAAFFRTLGVAPVLGRTFDEAEDQPGHEQVAVLSYYLWQSKFGGDPNVAGRTAELDGKPYTVMGVMPAGFVFPRATDFPQSFGFPRKTDLWIPLALPPGPAAPNAPDNLAVIARLRTSLPAAQAEMEVFARRMEADLPQAKGWFNSRVISLPQEVTGDVRRPLIL
jgi:hypothetical protein